MISWRVTDRRVSGKRTYNNRMIVRSREVCFLIKGLECMGKNLIQAITGSPKPMMKSIVRFVTAILNVTVGNPR